MSYVLEVLPALLNGAVVTLQVFFIVIVLSIPLGIVLAFLMQIKFKPLNWLLTLYVWIMRGTPLLLQLIFVYYVLPSVGIVFDRLPAAILAFTLNYAAYFAEIFRGGSWLFRKDNTKQRKCLNLVLSKPSATLSFLRWSRLSCQVSLTRLLTWLRIHHWFMCLGLETFFWKVVPLRTVMLP